MTAPRRELAVDVYRGLAVLMMFVVHARRLQSDQSWSGATAAAEVALDAFMWGEPFIAASFLFIVGFSLVLSRERARDLSAWVAQHFRRGAWLYLLAVGLFLPHYGLALPDLLLSPGILSAIAVAVVVVSLGLTSTRPALAAAAVTIAVLGVTGLLDGLGLSLSGLNAGPGGTLPLLAFTSAGAWFALTYRAQGRRSLVIAIVLALAPLIGVLALGSPWTQLHPSVHPHYGAEVALLEIFSTPTHSVHLLFWNHTVVGFLGLLFPLAGLFGVLVAMEHWLHEAPLTLLATIGRHALVAYVGHLIVLGLLEVAALTPSTPWHTWGLVAALGAAAAGGGAGLDARKRRPPQPADHGSVPVADSRRSPQ